MRQPLRLKRAERRRNEQPDKPRSLGKDTNQHVSLEQRRDHSAYQARDNSLIGHCPMRCLWPVFKIKWAAAAWWPRDTGLVCPNGSASGAAAGADSRTGKASFAKAILKPRPVNVSFAEVSKSRWKFQRCGEIILPRHQPFPGMLPDVRDCAAMPRDIQKLRVTGFVSRTLACGTLNPLQCVEHHLGGGL